MIIAVKYQPNDNRHLKEKAIPGTTSRGGAAFSAHTWERLYTTLYEKRSSWCWCQGLLHYPDLLIEVLRRVCSANFRSQAAFPEPE